MTNSTLSMDDKVELIFAKWESSLVNRDKRHEATAGNFSELFEKLNRELVPFDVAYQLVSKAARAHMPNSGIIENVYKKKNIPIPKDQWKKDWFKQIEDTAMNAFFEVYKSPLDEDPEDKMPKAYGNMSEKEYKAQRSHADSFVSVNTDELEKAYANSDNTIDLSKIFGDDGGETK